MREQTSYFLHDKSVQLVNSIQCQVARTELLAHSPRHIRAEISQMNLNVAREKNW